MPQETREENALRLFTEKLAARSDRNQYGVVVNWSTRVREAWDQDFRADDKPAFRRDADGWGTAGNLLKSPSLVLRMLPGTRLVTLGVEEPLGNAMTITSEGPRTILGRADITALRDACTSLLAGEIEER